MATQPQEKSASDGASARRKLRIRGALLALLSAGCCAVPAFAQSEEGYFHNKTIRIIIPSAPGGGRVFHTLPFAKYFGRHLPGNPSVQPVFMPGAGGSQAVNYTYNVAPPDGLTLVTPLVDVALAQTIGETSVKYDLSKMSWVGRTTDAIRVLFVWGTTPVHNLDDLRQHETIIGSAGRSTPTFSEPAVMNKVFGTKFKIVIGYKSAVDVNQAVELRETDAATTTWSDLTNLHADWIRDGKIRVLFQIGLTRIPELANVPLLSEQSADDESLQVIRFMSADSEIGEGFVTPPGVPPSVVDMLRRGFDETMRDPEYQAEVQKLNIKLNPRTGEEMTKIAAGILGAPKKIVDLYEAAVN
jgi:tripartite-type tricarboxylate transporter receptor subunit TctC